MGSKLVLKAGINVAAIAINTRRPECVFESEINLRVEFLIKEIELDVYIDIVYN